MMFSTDRSKIHVGFRAFMIVIGVFSFSEMSLADSYYGEFRFSMKGCVGEPHDRKIHSVINSAGDIFGSTLNQLANSVSGMGACEDGSERVYCPREYPAGSVYDNDTRVIGSFKYSEDCSGQIAGTLNVLWDVLPVACGCNKEPDSATNTCIAKTPITTNDFSLQAFYTYAQNANGDQCTVDATEYENSCSNTSTSHPIDCATGQKKYSEVDYAGFGLNPITYSRYYETPDLSEYDDEGVVYSSNGIGSGSYWDSNSVPSLSTITFEDGAYAKVFSIGKQIRRIFFYAAGSTSYTTNPNFDGISLVEESGFTIVTLASGYRYAFNATGTVANVTDDAGDSEYIYTWDDSTGINLLSRVANRFGRYLDYTYSTDGLLTALTDQDGISVHYEYDTNQNLTKVIYPDGTPNDLTDNPSKEYLFENTDFPSYVTGIVDQDGARLATIAYNDDGKAFSSELADGTDRVEVTYPTDSTSIVKFFRDVNADAYREEQYTFAKFRGQYKLTSKEITLCDNCELTTETWDYDSNELLIRHTSPAGTVTEYGYDAESRRISESIGVGTPEVRTTTYTWNDTHNQIDTITTATDKTTYTFDVDGNKTNTLITPVQ